MRRAFVKRGNSQPSPFDVRRRSGVHLQRCRRCTSIPTAGPPTARHNFNFEGRTKMFVSLFQIRRQHIFDPFHECADSARQIAPMCYDEGHGERPATKIGYDLHKRSTL